MYDVKMQDAIFYYSEKLNKIKPQSLPRFRFHFVRPAAQPKRRTERHNQRVRELPRVG